MYTMVERRTINRESMEASVQRAQTEFFPHLQAAHGFVGFYLVSDEANAVNTAVIVFESKEHFDAFDSTTVAKDWLRTLDELGHALLSGNSGETVIQLEAQK